jgi:hypothetical protein
MVKNSLRILMVCSALFFFSCSKNNSVVQREMNQLVFELLPFKADKQDKDIVTFKFTIKEKEHCGKITDYYKPSNYNKLLYYINQQLNNDFVINKEGKQIAPVMVHFEPNMKLTNTMVMLVAFEKTELTDESTFEFNDNLFNSGSIKFNINNDFNI